MVILRLVGYHQPSWSRTLKKIQNVNILLTASKRVTEFLAITLSVTDCAVYCVFHVTSKLQ